MIVKFPLILCAETKRQTDADAERITGRGVDSLRRLARRADARFKVILRFVVFFVEQIINRKIQISPFSQAFREAEIYHVVSGGTDIFIFAVEAVIGNMPPIQRRIKTVEFRQYKASVSHDFWCAVDKDSLARFVFNELTGEKRFENLR